MHTDKPQEKKPTGDGNPTAGHTDTGTVAATADADKEFATLAARYALAGHSLVRGGDRSASYYAMRWGHIKPLANLDEARRFLAQIGGRA